MTDRKKAGHTTSKNPAKTKTNKSIKGKRPDSKFGEIKIRDKKTGKAITLQELKDLIRKTPNSKIKIDGLPVPTAVMEEQEKLIATATGDVEFEKESYYKESRSLQKTKAKIVGRDRDQANLFTMQGLEERNTSREKLTKNAAILSSYLCQQWQEKKRDKDDFLVIKNLQKMATDLKLETNKLKTLLIMLGGFSYPMITTTSVDKKRGKKTIKTTHEFLFTIQFISEVDIKEDLDGLLIGTTYTNFVKGKDTKEILVKPHRLVIESYSSDKKGLGNILLTSRSILEAKELTDMGYKLFCFSSSNRPTYAIGWEKLIGHLGITEEEMRNQGRPRLEKQIIKALEELKDRGYMEYWRYDAKKDLFSWKCTSKYMKHKDSKKKKKIN